MKTCLTITLFALAFCLLFAFGSLCFAFGAVAGQDLERNKPNTQLNETQSHLDHERTMNWLLARRVEEQEKGK